MNDFKPDVGHDTSRARTTGAIMSEIILGLQGLVRGEIHLARAELQSTAREARRTVTLAIIFGVIALVGALPFLSFLIIGIGKLFGGRYWLSSLFVSILCIGTGVPAGLLFLRKLKFQDLTLPNTRESLRNEAGLIRNKVHEMNEKIVRRAS